MITALGSVLDYCIYKVSLADTIYNTYMILLQLILLVIICYILLLPNKTLFPCSLDCLCHTSSQAFECLSIDIFDLDLTPFDILLAKTWLSITITSITMVWKQLYQ